MTVISVVAWNLHQAIDRRPANIDRTWAYLSDELRPTVALIQEARLVPVTPGGNVASDSGAGYLTAVVGYGVRVEKLPEVITRYSRMHAFSIAPRVPGSFTAAQLIPAPDGVPLLAISLYGIMAPLYAQTAVLRAVADLIPLFDARAYNRRIVIGGDVNVYDQSLDRVERDRWLAILQVIESLGLVNLLKATRDQRVPAAGCPCGDPECWHVETFRHVRRRGEPGYFTNDYLFATRELAGKLTSFEVVNRPEVWEMSDHCPLVAVFDV